MFYNAENLRCRVRRTAAAGKIIEPGVLTLIYRRAGKSVRLSEIRLCSLRVTHRHARAWAKQVFIASAAAQPYIGAVNRPWVGLVTLSRARTRSHPNPPIDPWHMGAAATCLRRDLCPTEL